ncbi:TIM-barrel domain-containing protein, partial [Candidatus Bipolaricaulota bacterium]
MRFDEERLPSFRGMVDWLDSRNVSTLLWIGPWVMDAQRDEAMALGYDVRPTIPYLPGAALLDFTDPEAVAWWKTELKPVFH